MSRSLTAFLFIGILAITNFVLAADPLPSWNDGAAKKAVIDFVVKVTTQGSPDFVKPAERIATFDNDRTLLGRTADVFSITFCH
jgi:hypothetical protein